MSWNNLSPEDREAIILRAALRVAIAHAEPAPEPRVRVTMADLADYARGLARRPSAHAVNAAISDPTMFNALDRLLNRYSKVQVPLQAAAAVKPPEGSEERGRRRYAAHEVEIEWVTSSADVSAAFVRVHVPDWMRPLKQIVVRVGGEVAEIALVDDGSELELLMDRHSPAFRMLVDEASDLWLL